MKKSLAVAAFFLILKNFSLAQTAEKWPLESFLSRALEASSSVKKAKMDRTALEFQFKEMAARAQPQVYATADAGIFLNLPETFLDGELFGQPDFLAVQTGRPYQLAAGVRMDQKLIAPGFFSGGKMKDAARSVAELFVEKNEEEILFQTAQHFFQTAQNEALMNGLNANLEKIEALQKMAEIQFKNDLATRTDVKRLKVARVNLDVQKQNLELGIEYQMAVLKMLAGLAHDQKISLETASMIEKIDSSRWSSIAAPELGTTDVRLLFKNLEINRLKAKQARGENAPSLDFWAQLGGQSQRSDPNFFRNRLSDWFGSTGLGLRLRYPIFDGFGQKNRVQRLDIESKKTEEDVRQLENLKALEFSFAKKTMRQSLRNLAAQRENAALAVEVYSKVFQQYREGLASLTDVLSAQTAVSEAETALNREVFNYKLAELRFFKTVGRLKELLKN